jgi:hypothetical protein
MGGGGGLPAAELVAAKGLFWSGDATTGIDTLDYVTGIGNAHSICWHSV